MPPQPPSSPQRLSRAVAAFLRTEMAGALVLFAAAAGALVWANSPWRASHTDLWHTRLQIGAGSLVLEEDLRHWVNEGLMALFFFVVGLEVKREVVSGELRRWRTAALPSIAALGGMVVPALLYLAVAGRSAGAHGWGIPMATDIAFALGVLALVGRGSHPSLKLFLLTLAVVDDLGAIVVIAVVYSASVDGRWLLLAAGLIGLIVAAWRAGLRRLWPLAVLGAGVWLCFFQSGVHATIAGVVLGGLVPARTEAGHDVSLAERLEARLHPWTGLVVIPVFALANSGVRLTGLPHGDARTVAVGTAVGLVAGKVAGILVASYLAVRAGVGELPEGVDWRQLAGAAACGGIGFTVSLFVAGLAFDEPALTEGAKFGILGGSVLAAAAAAGLLLPGGRRPSRARR